MGSLMQIAWTSTGVSGGFRIQLIRPGGGLVGPLMNNVAGSPQNWTVAAPALVGEQYRVRVRALNDSAAGESAVFTVISGDPVIPGGAPTLQLLSPNGGESWPSGGTRNITWSALNWTGNVQLSLTQNGTYMGIIAKGLSSAQGSYPWLVGMTDKGSCGIGGGYRVHISRTYSGLKPHAFLGDASDGDFGIKIAMNPDSRSPVSLANIKMLVPKEGEVYHYGIGGKPVAEGVEVSIYWETKCAGPFQILLCDSNGNVIKPLRVVEKDGAYIQFTPKEEPVGTYRIKAQTMDGKCFGTSGRFSMKYMVYLGDKKPDLIVCKIDPRIVKANGNAPVTAYVRIYVKNIGNADANECTLRYTFQNGPSGESRIIPLPPLHSRGVTQIDLHGEFKGGGPWNYTLFADCLGVVDELKESNNILDGTIPNKEPEESVRCSDIDQ
jgi:hypothetical protein